jgi:hypothetical protein
VLEPEPAIGLELGFAGTAARAVFALATGAVSPHALHAVAMQTTVVMVSRFVALATLRFGFIFAFLYGAVNSDG